LRFRRVKHAAAAFALLLACGAHAQQWPTRAVRLVVPAAAGSSLDIVARAVSGELTARWRHPVVIENKPGAGGLVGVDAAAKASPDGHVMALGFNGPLAFAPFLYRRMPYDIRRDLAPVVLTSSQPNVLAVPARLPARSVRELIAWARTQPGGVTYASIGAGSSSHLAMELFARDARFTALHVAYNGSPAAALALARGDAQLLFAVASGLLPQVHSGQLRLLAVTSAKRDAGLPELPTLAESGLPGFSAEAWNGLVVAARTPDGIINRINEDVNAALGQPIVSERLRSLYMAPAGGGPQRFRELIAAEMQRWGPVIRQAGVVVD
jgi:tripartite-type tricarboxylate transporter receptor subunit TctC